MTFRHKILWKHWINMYIYTYMYVFLSIYLSQAKVLVAQSCPTLYDPIDCSPPGSSVRGDSPGKNTGVGSQFLLQGIFRPRDQTWVAGRFFTIWTTREYRYTYIHWKRKWQPFLLFLPGESHVQRSLGGYTVHGVPGVRHNLPTKLPSPPYIYMVIYIYIKPLENIFHFIYLFIYFAVK